MSTGLTIVLFIAAVLITSGFLVLLFTIIPAINQLRFLMKDLEKTSEEVRELTINLNELTYKISDKTESVGEILESSKKTLKIVSNTLGFVNKNILKKSSSLIALIPAIKFGWNLINKNKGGK